MLLLAIPGSLRAGSTHHAILDAARRLAPEGVDVETYDGVGALPHFNPDDEMAGPPAAVVALRERVGRADALLVSSPEYAHGMPGSLKNALDWLVGSTEFPYKPVALLGVAGRAEHATAQLTEVLTTMSARLVREACVRLPLSGAVTADGIVGDPARAEPLRAAVAALVAAARA